MLRDVSKIGLGAGLMYFLDLSAGRRRRAMLRDRMIGVLHDAEDAIGKGSRDVNNRLVGVVADLRRMLAPSGHVPDDVLIARVRSRMGRVIDHPHAVAVQAKEGHVTLAGPILAHEAADLIAAVRTVGGVTSVDDRLDRHETSAHVPALQGEGRAVSRVMGDWTPAGRLTAAVLGLAAASSGMRRGGMLGALLGLGGFGLFLRAMAKPAGSRLFGFSQSPQGLECHKSITVQAPIAEVFEAWRNPENFPRFMRHLSEVRRLDETHHRWVAKGPAGVPVEWESEIVRLEPNRVVAWRSVPGSTVETAGVVRFEPAGDATRVDIRFSYDPPAGRLGHIVASLFGTDPKHAMDEDIVRLKSLLEDGKTRFAGQTVTRNEITVESKPAGS